jgi:cytochrome c
MKFRFSIIGLICAVAIVSCSDKSGSDSDDPMSNKGVGPVRSLKLKEIDSHMAAAGEEIFKAKCTACHKIDKRYIGPELAGVASRRSPEWIMNMILNPEIMVVEDPVARQLLMEFSAPMANQNLTQDEARKVLEYFRTKS